MSLGSIGFSVLSFLFVLGVMIFIHELGHYMVAKLLGIRVEVFSLGFGKRLIGFQKGDTDYRISVLPLGGYVKMAGENYDEEVTGDPGEFVSHPKRHRFAVAVAGPAMNIGLALLLVAAYFMAGAPVASYLRQPALLGGVQSDSPAEEAGLRRGDTILFIDGQEVSTWQQAELRVSVNPGQELTFTIERGDEIFDTRITPVVAENMEIGTIGIQPFIPYVISQVERDSPAAQAGLLPEDEILEVRLGETAVVGFDASAELIHSSQGSPLDFQVRRGDRVFQQTIAPVLLADRWRIGTVVQVMELEKYGLVDSVRKSFERNYQLTLLTFEVVGRIITGRTSLKAMSGPIEIARYSGMAASMGLVQLVNFMALVSLQLGIFNLMPIPILDGGVISLLAIEGLIGRDLSVRVKERIFQVGFVFLILLMGIVIFNDLAKNLPILD